MGGRGSGRGGVRARLERAAIASSDDFMTFMRQNINDLKAVGVGSRGIVCCRVQRDVETVDTEESFGLWRNNSNRV